MTDLLPCPFCGSDDVRRESGIFPDQHYVSCVNCGASVDGKAPAWNTRTMKAQIDAAVKAERERCAVLIAKFDIPEDAAAAGTSFCRDAPSRVFAAAIRKGEQP